MTQPVVLTQGESDVQLPPFMRLAKCMKSPFLPTMACIVQQQYWLVEKHLLGLELVYAVLLALADVAGIPVKADDQRHVNQLRILSQDTTHA